MRQSPNMKEFKFNCPTCGQHILANTEWSGRKINCPSCQSQITIPSPKAAKRKMQIMPPSPRTHPKLLRGVMRIEAPRNALKQNPSEAPKFPPAKSQNQKISAEPSKPKTIGDTN